MAIKLITLLRWLTIPLLLGVLLFSITTALAFFATGTEWRWLDINWHKVFSFFDMRRENTLATWFSSTVFLTTGMALTLLGWGQAVSYTASQFQRWLFRLGALGCVLISADEVGSIHEAVGAWFDRSSGLLEGSAIKGVGYSWLILFAPIFLSAFAGMVYALWNNLKTLPNEKARYFAQSMLWLALLTLPSVLILESLEGLFHFLSHEFKHPDVFMTVLEEICEVTGMYCLFLSALWLAKTHDL